MNTIRNARKRPRVDSVSFRTFGWVLLREAFVQTMARPGHSYHNQFELRRWLCGRPTSWLVDTLMKVHARHPDWRMV